jgi:hypothetical protein
MHIYIYMLNLLALLLVSSDRMSHFKNIIKKFYINIYYLI